MRKNNKYCAFSHHNQLVLF